MRFHHPVVRYLLAVGTVAGTFALKGSLIPVTGTGGPFVLLFTAVMVTSLVAGVGPGICALLMSLPVAVYSLVTRAGAPPLQAAPQTVLFALDGIVIVYLTSLMKKGRQAAHDASRQLRSAHDESTRSIGRARAIIELAPDAFFQADLDARFTDVNDAACRLLGYQRHELIGKTIFDIIPVADAVRLNEVRADLLVPGRVSRAEWSLQRKDGTFVPVEVSANILPDGRWQAFVRDISERRRIELALQESEERFRLTFEDAPVGMSLVALDGRFVRVNRALCEIVGYSSAELTGLTFQAITHPDDLDKDSAAARQLVRGEIPRYQREKRYLSKDGTTVDVMLSSSLFRDRNGTPCYFISQIEDIRERKRAETALKESEQRLNLALDSGQVGMWDLDLLTDTSVRSLKHDQIFGYSSPLPTWGAAIFMTHVVPDDRAAAARAFENAFTSGNFDMECRIMWPDKSIRWISAKGRAYRNPQGRPTRMMGTVMDITELKAVEQRLKESEAMFSGIVSISADAIISIDDQQRMTIFNEGAAKIFGYSRSEAIGASLDMLIPERFRAAHREHVRRFADGTVTRHRLAAPLMTIAGLRKNGEEFPAEAAISKLQVGEKTLLTVALRDITRRKQIEEALKAANASLDAIVENIPLPLFIKDSQSLRFVRLNRACEEVLGWPRQILTGKSDFDLWPQEQAEFFVEKDRETLRSGKIVDIPEEPIQTRHQGVRILHTKKVPVLDSAGHPLYLLGISEDITERRRIDKEQHFLAEASVELSASLDYEQTLASVARLVVQNVADWCGVDLLDEYGHFRRIKVATADPDKAALSAVLERITPDRTRPDAIRSVLATRQPLVVEHMTPQFLEAMAQGPEHLQALLAMGLTSFMAVPLLMRGQPLGILMLGSSTPDRLFGPEDLRLAENLADRAAMAIENARLYGAAVQATQLRDEVLGVVAHDLRNPLSTIMLQTGILKRQGDEPDRRSQKSSEAIHRAATRMNRLIQDLLDVALIESGQLTIARAPLSARELLVEAVEVQRPFAAASSLEIRVDMEGDVPEILGDRDRLLQVFDNLIANAIKFTDAGGCITVSAAAGDPEIVFRVQDTGHGIAPEHLPLLFDRFWQATKIGRQGAGLGLPITKGIIEAHGGRIWVESTPDRGSTFSFTIPKAAREHVRRVA
jgi:PAS domain S-box-containing protein